MIEAASNAASSRRRARRLDTTIHFSATARSPSGALAPPDLAGRPQPHQLVRAAIARHRELSLATRKEFGQG